MFWSAYKVETDLEFSEFQPDGNAHLLSFFYLQENYCSDIDFEHADFCFARLSLLLPSPPFLIFSWPGVLNKRILYPFTISQNSWSFESSSQFWRKWKILLPRGIFCFNSFGNISFIKNERVLIFLVELVQLK